MVKKRSMKKKIRRRTPCKTYKSSRNISRKASILKVKKPKKTRKPRKTMKTYRKRNKKVMGGG
jgi:hypothetical protein